MRRNLLAMVRDILNDLDSDDVASISDTVEAQQVAQILESCYYEMMSNRNWPHTKKLIKLKRSSVEEPVYLAIPSSVKEISEIRYNTEEYEVPTLPTLVMTDSEPTPSSEFFEAVLFDELSAYPSTVFSPITSGSDYSGVTFLQEGTYGLNFEFKIENE